MNGTEREALRDMMTTLVDRASEQRSKDALRICTAIGLASEAIANALRDVAAALRDRCAGDSEEPEPRRVKTLEPP